MNEQIGWRGLIERLQREAPRYAHLLPELPRLLHTRLAGPPQGGGLTPQQWAALWTEQRRTHRLLRGLVWGLVGFVAGLLVARLLTQVSLL